MSTISFFADADYNANIQAIKDLSACSNPEPAYDIKFPNETGIKAYPSSLDIAAFIVTNVITVDDYEAVGSG